MRHFTLLSDHRNLLSLFGLNPKQATLRLARLALQLAEYEFTAKHIACSKNKIADYLSRDAKPTETTDLVMVIQCAEETLDMSRLVLEMVIHLSRAKTHPELLQMTTMSNAQDIDSTDGDHYNDFEAASDSDSSSSSTVIDQTIKIEPRQREPICNVD